MDIRSDPDKPVTDASGATTGNPTFFGADGVTDAGGWSATLRCRFDASAGRTTLALRRQRGPLLLQRPFYPEAGGVCHVYVIHPPGGVVGGDWLEQDMELCAGAQALVTTPAATKCYRSAGALAHVRAHLRLADGAQLEWLPQATLLFNGARIRMATVVELAPTAHFLGWETLVFGRAASDERFDRGHLGQRFELWRGDRPLWIERLNCAGGDPLLREPWGLSGMPVSATMVCTSTDPERLVLAARSLPACAVPGQAAATALPEVAVYRYIGPWAASAQAHLMAVWAAWRPLAFQRAACAPRIWAT